MFLIKNLLFYQKRSSNKPHGCIYAESVCAHVRYGENYLVTAKRRIKEELGIGIDRSIELRDNKRSSLY